MFKFIILKSKPSLIACRTRQCIISFCFWLHSWRIPLLPHFEFRRLKLIKAKELQQCHKANKWQSLGHMLYGFSPLKFVENFLRHHKCSICARREYVCICWVKCSIYVQWVKFVNLLIKIYIHIHFPLVILWKEMC